MMWAKDCVRLDSELLAKHWLIRKFSRSMMAVLSILMLLLAVKLTCCCAIQHPST